MIDVDKRGDSEWAEAANSEGTLRKRQSRERDRETRNALWIWRAMTSAGTREGLCDRVAGVAQRFP